MKTTTRLLSAAVGLACASVAQAGTLLSFDFNGENPWKSAATDVMPSTPVPVEPATPAELARLRDEVREIRAFLLGEESEQRD